MKFRYIVAALLFLALISCKRTEKVEYFKDGSISKKTVYTTPDKSSYRETHFYDGERVKGLHEFTDGIQNGRSFNYYPNGEIQSVFYYNMGKLTSIARYFDQNGRLTDKGLFINDSLVVKEEFYYTGNLTEVSVFAKNNGEFSESGSLLVNSKGYAGLDNSFYYTVHSLDSIPLGDSIRINVNFIARKKGSMRLVLTLGSLDENLQFLTKDKTYMSDSMAISFYYKSRKKDYNLLTGKLRYVDHVTNKTDEFVFFHDFLVY